MKRIRPAVMTVTELAEYLRVTRSTIYRLLRKKKLHAFRIGIDYRFNRESVERWIKKEQLKPKRRKR